MHSNYMDNILDKSKRKRLMKRMLSLLCAVVIFFTFNTLKHNANTLVRTANCGFPDHEHTQDCYNAAGELTCELHVHTDACYQSSAGAEVVSEEVETPVSEAEIASEEAGTPVSEAEIASEEVEMPVSEADALELGEEIPEIDETTTDDAAMEAEPASSAEYTVGSRSVILLSDMLQSLDMNVSGIVNVGQLIEDDAAPALIEVAKTGEDYEVRPLSAFDEAELAIETEDDIVLVKLVGSQVQPGDEAQDEDAYVLTDDSDAAAYENEAIDEGDPVDPVEPAEDENEAMPEAIPAPADPEADEETEEVGQAEQGEAPVDGEAETTEPSGEAKQNEAPEDDETEVKEPSEDATEAEQGEAPADGETEAKEPSEDADKAEQGEAPKASGTDEASAEAGEPKQDEAADKDSDAIAPLPGDQAEVGEADAEAAEAEDAEEAQKLSYTFGEEKTVYVSELLENAEITLNAYYYSVLVSDHSAVKLEPQLEPYDCAVTALTWFDAVKLTVRASGEQYVFELRNPEPGDRKTAGDAMASEDGRGSVVFNDDVVLPKGTSLTVDAVNPEFDDDTKADIEQKLAQIMGDSAVDVHWFDISLGDVHEVQATVTVENVLEEAPAEDVRPVIIHVTDEGDIVIIEDVQIDENGSVTFPTDGFSTFGLAVPNSGARLMAAASITPYATLTVNTATTGISMNSTDRYLMFTPTASHKYSFAFGNLSKTTTKYFTLCDAEGNEIGTTQSTTSSTTYTATWDVKLEVGQTYYIRYKRASGTVSSVTCKPTYEEHTFENHVCIDCGYAEPWYIDDNGKLIIHSDDALNYSAYSAAPWYERRNEIKSIEIEDGVTKLPAYFLGDSNGTNNYPNLTSVTLGADVTSIGDYAFSGCKGLTGIEGMEHIQKIGTGTFLNCTGLTAVETESLTSLGSSAFKGCTGLTTVDLGNVTSVPESAFSGCTKLASVTGLENVTSIGNYAFQNCPLTSVELGSDLKSIGTSAFYGCTALTNVELNGANCSIGGSAFYNCSALTTISGTENVSSIGGNAFQSCAKLTGIEPGTKLTSIGSNAFIGCRALKDVDLSDATGLTTIGLNAFKDCSALDNVYIPLNVNSMGTAVFQNCTGLKTVEFDNKNTMTSLPDKTFDGCTGLSSITMPQDITSIGDYAFNNCRALTEIDIPGSVTSIGSYAFQNCANLAEAELPKTVKTIGANAFYGCTVLEAQTFPKTLTSIGTSAYASCKAIDSVELPSSVTSLGTSVFSGCTALESADLSKCASLNSLPNSTFSGCTKLNEVSLSNSMTSIGSNAMSSCTALTEVDLPDKLQSIDDSAFNGCSKLSVVDNGDEGIVELPETLTNIGSRAFYNCDSFKEIVIPDSVTKIGTSAVANCANLEKATVGAGVTTLPSSSYTTGVFYNDPKLKTIINNCTQIKEIPIGAYYGLSSLEEFTLWEGLETINRAAFALTGLKSVKFPSTLTAIKDGTGTSSSKRGAFANCTSLESVEFEDGNEALTIGNYTFYNDTKLTDVRLPSNLTSIGNRAFYGCAKMKDVELPEGLTNIGTYAFNNCDGLTTVDMPGTVTTLGTYAYYDCDKLTTVDMSETQITTIPQNAFQSCDNLTDVTLPAGVKIIDSSAFYECVKMKTVELPDKLEKINSNAFRNCDGLTEAIMPGTVTTLGTNAYYDCDKLTTVDMSKTQITTIPQSAFYSCNELTDVTLPKGVTTIDSNAFYYCEKMKSVELPEGLTTINGSAFYNCDGLTEAIMPSTVMTLGTSAYYDCDKLTKVDMSGTKITSIPTSAFQSCDNLTDVKLPQNVETIGTSAFYECVKMESVELPEGLTTINGSAFYNCDGLTEVNMPSTVTTLGTYAYYHCDKLKTADMSKTAITTIPESTFQSCVKLADVKLPENLKIIGQNAFAECKSLDNVKTPATLETIGQNAFKSCTGMRDLDLSASDALKTISASAFQSCDNLRNIQWPEGASDVTIGKNAFTDCAKLQSAELPDAVTSIGEGAFKGCSDVGKVRIPTDVEAIGKDAFTGCVGLTDMVWDAKTDTATDPETGKTVSILKAFDSKTHFTLTLGSNVDNITRDTLNTLIEGGANALKFEEGAIHLPDMTGLKLPRPLSNLPEGDYYADAKGALYIIEKGEATLVYVPDGLDSYTVPETLPTGETVTGVRNSALLQAQALTELTFDAPDKIKKLEAYAFAYARNLERINGETTPSGAKSLFPNAKKGIELFYETKLKEALPENANLVGGQLEYGKKDDSWKGIELTINEIGSSYRDSMDGKTVASSAHDLKTEDNIYIAYTGETVKTEIIISNPESAEIIPDDMIRVYFRIDDGGTIFPAPGSYPANLDYNREVQPGEKTTEDFIVSTTEVDGLYYMQIPRLPLGATALVEVTTEFGSPTTGGGNVVVWAEYFKAAEVRSTKNSAREPREDYHLINRTTRRNDFDISKNSQSNKALTVQMKPYSEDDYRAFVSKQTYTIKMSKAKTNEPKKFNVGRDYMASAEFVDTLQLVHEDEEGNTVTEALLDDRIKQDIDNNRITYSYDANSYTVNIYAPSWSATTPAFTFKGTSSDLRNYMPRISLVGKNPQFTWKEINPNPNMNGGAEIQNLTVTMTVADDVLYLPNPDPEKKYKIENDVEVTQNYTYSGSVTLSDAASYEAAVGEAKLSIEKTADQPEHYRGEYAPYTITLRSTGVMPITGELLTEVSDTIDSNDNSYARYIKPDDIWKMFEAKEFGKALRLDISSAHLYGPTETELKGTQLSATAIDENDVSTDQQNTGYLTDHSGAETVDTYERCTDAQFTFARNEEGEVCVTLTQGDETLDTAVVGSGEDIRNFFNKNGFFVTADTRYKVSWDITKIKNTMIVDGEEKEVGFSIAGGEKKEIEVRTTLKDSFMRTSADVRRYYGFNDYDIVKTSASNRATAKFNKGTLNSNTVTTYNRKEAEISKGISTVETKSEYIDENNPKLEYATVFQYTVTATHYGTERYDEMPVTDHMTLRQTLLVPVEKNTHLVPCGLETRTVDSVEYYVLNKEGTYLNVWTGDARADRVEVKALGDGKFDTVMYWYIPNFGEKTTNSIKYMAAVERNPFMVNGRVVSYANETWLGDHETHRLYDVVANDSGYYNGKFLVTEWNKRIVSKVGDRSAGTTYSFVENGDKVVYRLTFINDNEDDKEFSIYGKDFYDVLPKIIDDWEWSKDNVKLDYVGFKTNDPNGTKWNIVSCDDPNSSVRSYAQKIVWDNDFVMTCNDPDGRGDIFVTVEFPSDFDWDAYVREYGSTMLYNTLYVRNNGRNFDAMSVEHELAERGNVRLQKGVYATGVVNRGLDEEDRTDIYNTGVESRLHFEADEQLDRKVYYYITLYNGGTTNLYLNKVQDVLPKGLTLVTDPIGVHAINPRIVSSDYARVEAGDNGPVNYVRESTYQYPEISTTRSTLTDGRQRVEMELQPYDQYNKRVGKYFLKPNQAMVIRLECYTSEDAGYLADNVAAMAYDDRFNLGLEINDSSSTSVDNKTNVGALKNDGDCEKIDTVQAGQQGFNTTGESYATDWLFSEVELDRGAINPAVNKWARWSYKKVNEYNEVMEEWPTGIYPTDRVTWMINAFNDGERNIEDYVITDIMPQPFNFKGNVTYTQTLNGGDAKLPEITLFSIERETEKIGEGSSAIEQVKPDMTLIDYKKEGHALTLGGGEASIPVLWNGKETSVTVRMDVDEDKNEVMHIRFADRSLHIPADGKVTMYIESANLIRLLQNKDFINEVILTPAEENWDTTPREGRQVWEDNPFYDGELNKGVFNNASVYASFGGSTESIKDIYEVDDPSNFGSSVPQYGPDTITLPDRTHEFRYRLRVTNHMNHSIRKLVLIDNLPEVGDHTVFQKDDLRSSEFKVSLFEDPDFKLTISHFNEEKEDTDFETVPSGKYRIEVSTKTEFEREDWTGTSSGDWETLSSDNIDKARSIRVVFEDPSEAGKADGDYLFKNNYEMWLEFTAKIDDPDALPGMTAWNGFGYYYNIFGNDNDMQAAPRLVAVRIPDLPKVNKSLINSVGETYAAEEDQTFEFVIYTGEALSLDGLTRGDQIKAIEAAERDYAIVEMKVKKGESEGDSIDFNDAIGHYHTKYEDETQPWIMKDGTYTLTELAKDKFALMSINEVKADAYTFIYRANADQQVFTCVNAHDDWILTVLKRDQLVRAVKGAQFAVYSSLETEKANPVPTAEGIDDIPETLESDDGTIYYLMRVETTNADGEFRMERLNADSYLLKELSVPAGYVKREAPIPIERNGRINATERITNTYKASGSETLEAVKTLEGRDLIEDEFSFELHGFDMAWKIVDDNAAPMPEKRVAQNNTDGSVSFGAIHCDENDIGKTYYYRIAEVIPGAEQRKAGVTYDESVWYAKIEVEDAGEGKLKIKKSYVSFDADWQETPLEQASFTNRYEGRTSTSIPLEKTLLRRKWNNNEGYTFYLAEQMADGTEGQTLTGSVKKKSNSPDPVETPIALNYTQADIGTHTYTLYERIPGSAVAYNEAKDETIYETVNGKQKPLKYSRYLLNPEAYADLQPIKWRLRGVVYDDTKHTVKVEVSYDDNQQKLTTEITLDGDPFDPTNDKASFTNTYVPERVEATVSVKKNMMGRPLLRADKFWFDIAPVDGAPMPKETRVEFIRESEPKFFIEYNWTDLLGEGEDLEDAEVLKKAEKGKEFEYVVTEVLPDEDGAIKKTNPETGKVTYYRYDQITYDVSEHGVKVKLWYDTDEGVLKTEVTYLYDTDNKATLFENTYKTDPIKVEFPLKKLVNDAPSRQNYTFELYREGAEAPLKTIVYDPAEADENGVIKVEIPDELGTGITVKNLTQTYKYYLKEKDEKKPGVTYDGKQIDIAVTVTLDNRVTYRLEPTIVYTVDGKKAPEAVFENEYAAEGTLPVSVSKKLEGRAFNGEEGFTFTLTPVDGAPMPGDNTSLGGVVTAEKDADTGVKSLGTLSYMLADITDENGAWPTGEDDAKTFRYVIRETVPDGAVTADFDDPELTYGTATEAQRKEYTWTLNGLTYAQDQTLMVRVYDNGNGTLSVAPVDYDPKTGLAFTNTYAPEPVVASFPVRKEIHDVEDNNLPDWKLYADPNDPDGGVKPDWSDEKYTFVLEPEEREGTPMPKDEDGKVVDRVQVDHDNPVGSFSGIEFKKPGTFKYKISEDGVNADSPFSLDKNMRFDPGHALRIEVTDDGSGRLKAEVFWDNNTDPATDAKPVLFVNRELSGTCSITIQKVWMENGVKVDNPSEEAIDSIVVHLFRKSGTDATNSTVKEMELIDGVLSVKDYGKAEPFKLTKAEGWSLKVDDLPNYDIGKDGEPVFYRYYVVEDKVGSWEISSYFNGVDTVDGKGEADSIALKGGGTITITNSTYSVSLPTTGGPGTALYTASGLALIALALALLLRKRRA